jgi:penicillin amidase
VALGADSQSFRPPARRANACGKPRAGGVSWGDLSAHQSRKCSRTNSLKYAIAGASVRLVMDVGAWDNSKMMNTPGQSADPYSAHYRDLFPMWAEGSYVPLAFSREAVDRVAERVIMLTPAN